MTENRDLTPSEIIDELEVTGTIDHVEAYKRRIKLGEIIPADETILQEAQRLVHGQRNDDYGHPADDFAKTAKIWTGILLPKLKGEITPQDVALCMIGVKISRQVNKHKRDNLVDIVGYAATAQMIEEKTNNRAADGSEKPEVTT